MLSKVAIRAVPRFQHVIPRMHSIGYQIYRRYTTFGDGLQQDAGSGAGKLLVGNDLEGEKPLTIPQRMSLLEKNMASATSDIKSMFKWAGGALLTLFGGKFYFDNAMENRLVKRMDDQEAKFDKRMDDQEAKFDKRLGGQETRLKEYMATGLHQLRLEIHNDRLNDQLSAKEKKVEV